MDLGYILGVAMILLIAGSSVQDRRRFRTFDEPGREPVARPPASTPQTRKAEELARNRIARIRERGLGTLLLDDFRFSARITPKEMGSPEAVRNSLNGMLQEMLRHLRLPGPFTVEVIPDEAMSVAPKRGAECDIAHRRINVYFRSWYKPEQLTAMLCHECAHYFCYHYGMYEFDDFMLNEWYTDTVACLTGFSKYMLFAAGTGYLEHEQMEAVRWTLLQERKNGGAAGKPQR